MGQRRMSMAWFANLPKTARIAITILLLAAVSYADYISGVTASLSLFYLAPVALSAWFVGRAWGSAMAVASAASWYITDWLAGKEFAGFWVFVWNILLMAGVYLTVAIVLDSLRKALLREREMALTDSLTGLANSRGFFIEANREIERSRRSGSPMAFLYLDLDEFKRINDTLGHMEGDNVLRSIADALRDECRAADVIARLGGDEFAVLFQDTTAEEARAITSRLFESLSDKSRNGLLRVTVSGGLVAYSTPPISVDLALIEADSAMYGQKTSGKNGVGYKAGSPMARE